MPERTFRLHLQLIAILLVGHLFVNGMHLFVGRGRLFGLSGKLNFVEEGSLPNFFSAAALLVAAAVAATIVHVSSVRNSRLTGCWFMAAAVLMFLAFDEGAGIHDLLAIPLQRVFGGRGFLFIGWVVPYAILTFVVAYRLLPLARSLSLATRNRLIVAATVYVSAAMGVEMLEAVLMDHSTLGGLESVDFETVNRTPKMILLVTIEELFEMAGVALALRALLIHLTQELDVKLFGAEIVVDTGAVLPHSGFHRGGPLGRP